jgi:hypothetical protein
MKRMIIYDLKDKDKNQRSRILQLLYGYTDNSNYDYSYERKGFLDGIKYKKEKKTVIYVEKRNVVKYTFQ